MLPDTSRTMVGHVMMGKSWRLSNTFSLKPSFVSQVRHQDKNMKKKYFNNDFLSADFWQKLCHEKVSQISVARRSALNLRSCHSFIKLTQSMLQSMQSMSSDIAKYITPMVYTRQGWLLVVVIVIQQSLCSSVAQDGIILMGFRLMRPDQV